MAVTPINILSMESKLPSCLWLINEEPSIRLTFYILSFYFILDFVFFSSDWMLDKIGDCDYCCLGTNFTWRFICPLRGFLFNIVSYLLDYFIINYTMLWNILKYKYLKIIKSIIGDIIKDYQFIHLDYRFTFSWILFFVFSLPTLGGDLIILVSFYLFPYHHYLFYLNPHEFIILKSWFLLLDLHSISWFECSHACGCLHLFVNSF